jgi:immunity protein 10 of polymorphic toxin system
MTLLAFEASKIATVDPDGNCHLVGFASDRTDPQNYLMLQRSFSHDERDWTSGQDTYYFELSRHDCARYGGIAAFNLSRNQAEISFEPETIKALGEISHVVITFNASDTEYAALSQKLQIIFAGTGRLVASNA